MKYFKDIDEVIVNARALLKFACNATQFIKMDYPYDDLIKVMEKEFDVKISWSDIEDTNSSIYRVMLALGFLNKNDEHRCMTKLSHGDYSFTPSAFGRELNGLWERDEIFQKAKETIENVVGNNAPLSVWKMVLLKLIERKTDEYINDSTKVKSGEIL